MYKYDRPHQVVCFDDRSCLVAAAVAAAADDVAAAASFAVGGADFDRIPFDAGRYSARRTNGSCYRLGIVVVDSNSSLRRSVASKPSCV